MDQRERQQWDEATDGAGLAEFRLRLALDAAGLGIWDRDMQSGALTLDARAKAIHGFPLPATPTHRDIQALTHPEDLERVSAMAARALDPAIREKRPYEYRIRRADDGSVRWLAAHGAALFAPGDGGAMQAVRYIGTVREIPEGDAIAAERAAAARQLAEQEARFEAVLDATALEISIFGPDGRYLQASERIARQLGRPRHDFVGRTMAEMGVDPALAERMTAQLAAALATGERVADVHAAGPGPGDRVLEYAISRVAAPDGGVLGAVMSAHDVTAQRAAELALRQALVERHAALRELSHRAKNTLQMVSSLLNLQLARLGDPAAQRDMEAAYRRITAIGNAHAALYGESPEDPAGTLDFGALLSIICYTVGSQLNPADRITLAVTAEPLRLSADAAIPLALIANELVSNAFRHAFPGEGGGRVTVTFRARPEGGHVLSVADDGCGPPAGSAARRGLGLLLVNAFVAQLGGSAHTETGPGLTTRIEIPG